MRSFEEYISESKQNYIFGGIDDRNTDIEINREIELPDKLEKFLNNKHDVRILLGAIDIADRKGWKDITDTFNEEMPDMTLGYFYKNSSYDIRYIDRDADPDTLVSYNDNIKVYTLYFYKIPNSPERILKIVDINDGNILFVGLKRNK